MHPALLALSLAADPAALVARGDAAFAERDDPARLAAALEAYGRAAEADPGGEAELRLSRAWAFRALSDRAAAREAWSSSARAAERALRRLAPAWAAAIDAGAGAAEAAVKVGPPGAEALYRLALASYSGAQARGFAAVLAVKDAALAMMERAAALDERVDFAGPLRALGAWRAGLPGGAGGGAAAARARFERARELFPAFQLTNVWMAETYAVLVQDRKLFDALLAAVRDCDASKATEMAPENRLAKRLAEELLGRRDRLF
jgi:TRAP transporter T-component